MAQAHHKNLELPGDKEQFTGQTHKPKAPTGPAPRLVGEPLPPTGNTASRQTALAVIEGPLAAQRDSLTLIGGQAVMLRCHDRYGFAADTMDADFAITPQLVSDDPNIEEALLTAGFQPRNPDRPGLWGRYPVTDPVSGRVVFTEQIDLDCPMALAGATSPKRRSVPALAGHGKHATGTAVGLELAAFDRDLMNVPDLTDPSHSVTMWVAGQAGLMCAKGYKIGERIFDTGRFVRSKDYIDLFLLMDSGDPARVRSVFDQYRRHPAIGASVRQGAVYLSKIISDETVWGRCAEAVNSRVPAAALAGLRETWRPVFGSPGR